MPTFQELHDIISAEPGCTYEEKLVDVFGQRRLCCCFKRETIVGLKQFPFFMDDIDFDNRTIFAILRGLKFNDDDIERMVGHWLQPQRPRRPSS